MLSNRIQNLAESATIAMAQKAREENEALKARIDALEKGS